MQINPVLSSNPKQSGARYGSGPAKATLQTVASRRTPAIQAGSGLSLPLLLIMNHGAFTDNMIPAISGPAELKVRRLLTGTRTRYSLEKLTRG
jgi:hypothetical protein